MGESLDAMYSNSLFDINITGIRINNSKEHGYTGSLHYLTNESVNPKNIS